MDSDGAVAAARGPSSSLRGRLAATAPGARQQRNGVHDGIGRGQDDVAEARDARVVSPAGLDRQPVPSNLRRFSALTAEQRLEAQGGERLLVAAGDGQEPPSDGSGVRVAPHFELARSLDEVPRRLGVVPTRVRDPAAPEGEEGPFAERVARQPRQPV
jgi:hypothetical protein